MKQADQSWGAPTGTSEWNDEKAAETIAQEEKAVETPVAGAGWDNSDNAEWVDNESKAAAAETVNVDTGPDPSTAEPAQPAAEPEPEDNSRSYADYLAEQAEKKLKLGESLTVRKPNEGSKQDEKWAEAKAFTKDDEEDEYIAGKGGKEKRERQRKEKTRVDVDLRYVEPSPGGGRGGGGGGRGGRGRGEYRGGDRGRGESRGGDRGRGGRGRGDGYRGRGMDGGYRGARGGGGGSREGASSVNVEDQKAFPSLGGS